MKFPRRAVDLVIMNPPFTRPTGHEGKKKGVPVPSFAGFGTSEEEQRAMSRHLDRMRAALDRPAGNGNAGLASNFIDVAEEMVREGGHLALVPPAAFAAGGSWRAARELLARNYRDHLVVAIAATGTTERAFSADTGMADCLVVSTRRAEGEQGGEDALFVNLRQRPRSLVEALQVAGAIKRIPKGARRGDVTLAGRSIGHCARGSLLRDGGLAQAGSGSVVRACEALARGELRLPGTRPARSLPMARLGELGERGPYHSDIRFSTDPRTGRPRGAFDLLERRENAEFPMLWNHDHERERHLVVAPDSRGAAREGLEEKAAALWERHAARLHFNRDFQLSSQPLAACITPGKALGGTAWPGFRLREPAHLLPVLLWANSTLGLMCFWWRGTRQQETRARISIGRLPGLPVLDPRELAQKRLKACEALFERIRPMEFLPARMACEDGTRIALDEALLTDVLGLPEETLEPLALLRAQWCGEPTVRGGAGRDGRRGRRAPTRRSG